MRRAAVWTPPNTSTSPGLLFLKYVYDAFGEQHRKLEAEEVQEADPEDPDEYRALNIIWVTPEAHWWHRNANAPQSIIRLLCEPMLFRRGDIVDARTRS